MSVSFKPVSRLRGHRAAVSCLEAGQPGSTFEHRLLSGGEDGISRLWDVQRGLSIRGFLPPGNDALGSICLGKGAVEHCIFVTKGKDIHVFDARIQEPVLRNVMGSLPGAEDDISMLGLHAAGTLLAAADDAGDIQVFDMVAGERQCVIEEAHESLCSAVAFRPGATDEIHSGGFDLQSARWTATTGALIAEWSFATATDEEQPSQMVNPRHVHSLCYSVDGSTIAFALGDGAVELRDADSGALLTSIEAHQAAASQVLLLSSWRADYRQPLVSADESLLVSAGNDSYIHMFAAGQSSAGDEQAATEQTLASRPIASTRFDHKPNSIAAMGTGSATGTMVYMANTSSIILGLSLEGVSYD